MGAGKSSVGRALGRRLNWIFEDLDDRIERQEGRPVPDIFRDSGEQEFRRAEHDALRNLLDECSARIRRSAGGSTAVAGASRPRPAGRVIALGGGAFVQKMNAALLKASGVPTIFLDAPVDELWRRCCKHAAEAGAVRPLLRSPEQFRQLYRSRRPGYAKAAVAISTSNRTVEEVAAQIAETLGLKEIGIRIEQGEVE
jgi:shikimate kinase